MTYGVTWGEGAPDIASLTGSPSVTFGTAYVDGTNVTLLASDATLKYPTSLMSAANSSTITLTNNATDQTLTGSLGLLNIAPAGDMKITLSGSTKQINIPSTSGHDTGIYITNSGAGVNDTAAVTVNGPDGFATLFVSNSANVLPSTCGFYNNLLNGFTVAANKFTVTDGNFNVKFNFDLTNARLGIRVVPSYNIHVLDASPVTFAGQVTTDAGSEYIEYAGLWSGATIVATSRIQRDATNSSWDLDLYGSNWGGALTKGLSVIGAQKVQVLTKLAVNAINIETDTTTGTKIGTGTTQKLAFWNSAPVIQQTAAAVVLGYTANVTANFVYDASTFTGNIGATAYTIGDIVAALKTEGLITT